MDVRLLKPKDTQAARELWDICFDDNTPAFTQWFFSQKFSPENTVAAFAGTKLIGCVQMLPYRFMLRGRFIEGASIAGVCTHPDARGRGVAKRLMAESDRILRERGRPLATLYPSVSYAFYTHLGWEIVTERTRLEFAAGEMVVPMPQGYESRPLETSDRQALFALYDQVVLPLSISAQRDISVWEKRLSEIYSDGGQALAVCKTGAEQGALVGYALYHIDAGMLELDEAAYIDEGAGRALLHGLMQLPAKQYRVFLPADTHLGRLISDGRGRRYVEPFLMARAVDAPALLKHLSWQGEDRPFILQVTDDLAPWNDGVWCFQPGPNGEVCMQRTRLAPDAQIGVGALMQWICGYQAAQTTWMLGGIKIKTPGVIEQMDSLFEPSPTGGFEMY